MSEYFNMDSFGANCPKNWEEISDYLNEKASEMEITDEDGNVTRDGKDALADLWEAYWGGDLVDAPEAIPLRVVDLMEDDPEDNMKWCKPYISNDRKHTVIMRDGVIEGKDGPLSEEELHALAMEVNPDYAEYIGWNDKVITLCGMRGTGCWYCPHRDECDAMQERVY